MSNFWSGFMNFVQVASFFLFLILLFLLVIAFSSLQKLTRQVRRLRRRLDDLFQGEEIDVEELLNLHHRRLTEQQDILDKLVKKSGEQEIRLKATLQKLGFVKYNAFPGLTNELSFSIALLDEYNNGLILTSIFGQEGTTSFAKEVRSGRPSNELSKEEKEALEEALKQ